MGKTTLLLSILINVLVSCHESKSYRPDHLRKLTEQELIERVRKRNFFRMEDVVFKDSLGKPILEQVLLKSSNPINRIGVNAYLID